MGFDASSLIKPKTFISRSLAEMIKDPAPSWLWTFTAIGVKDLPFINPLYVTDIDLGFRHIQHEDILWGGQYTQVPAGPTGYPHLTMGMYEDHRYYSTSVLDKWLSQAVNKSNYAGLPKNYCGTGYLIAFDTMGYPVLEVTIKGMWPVSHSSLQFGQRSGPIVKQASFVYRDISYITEETAVSGIIGEAAGTLGLGDGTTSLIQGGVGGGLTMVPGL